MIIQRRTSRRWKAMLTAAAAALGVAVLGGVMTDLGPWYYSLRQPSWKPPDWLFGPAWTLIFALAAVSGYLGWRRAPDKETREWMLVLFAANAFLNVLWTLLFFGLHRPDWALYEVGFLWLSIVVLIVFLRRFSGAGSWLLAPYVAWVGFAAAVNLAVVQLNGPFAAP